MERVTTDDRDVIAYRGGGSGGGIAIGLGLLLLIGLLAWVTMEGLRRWDWFTVVSLALLAVVAFAGIALILGRHGLELDVRSHTYRRWFALGVRLVGWTGNLSDFTGVDLSRTVVGNPLADKWKYRLALERTGGSLTIWTSGEELASRAEAERLARRLVVPLRDHTFGHVVISQPHQIGTSIRDRRSSDGRQDTPLPPEPEKLRTRVLTQDETIIFQIPRPRFLSRYTLRYAWSLAAAGGLIWLFVMWVLLPGGGPGRRVNLIELAVGIAINVLPSLYLIGRFVERVAARTTVAASPDGLRIERSWALGASITVLRADLIRDVLIDTSTRSARAGAIVAIAGNETVAFGAHLPDAEKHWIRAVIEQIVSV